MCAGARGKHYCVTAIGAAKPPEPSFMRVLAAFVIVDEIIS